MRTEQIYYALAVAQTGSFSKAAEQFYIKQQSLRIAVTHLEEELQVVLFERTPRGVTMTAEGGRCLEELRQMLSIYEGIKTRGAAEHAKTLLTIGTNSYGSQILSHFIDDLAQHYPLLQLKVMEKAHPLTLVEGILNSELDCAVTTIAANILSDDQTLADNLHKALAFKPLAKLHVGVYLKRDHPLAGSKEQEELVFLPLEKEVPLILGLFYPLETPASPEIFRVMHSLEQAYIKRQHEDPIL